MLRPLLLTISTVILTTASFAQTDSLENILNEGAAPKKEYVQGAFKATRIINSASVENLGMGILDFRISHRFGQLNEGSTNFFGLDDATTRLGLDYGITKWLMVGIGHSTGSKENDGSVKIKLLRQQVHGMPITLSYNGDLAIKAGPNPTVPAGDTYKFSNKMYYANQLLLARKFNNWLSLELMPTIIHYNLVDSSKFDNNTVAIGVGGRIKVSRRIAITGEYYYRLSNTDLLVQGQKTYNSLSLGIDIETGGHVFQLLFTNSTGFTERNFVGQTTGSWGKGDIHFGFNISRIFTIVKPKEFKGSKNSIY